MTINRIHVSGYRSLRDLHVDLKQLNVIVGANGSGKSNFYRALYLLSAAATGQFARELANEGGIGSVLWAGDRRKDEEPRVTVEVELDELEYTLVFGRVPNSDVFTEDLLCFSNDPDIKSEEVRSNYRGKSHVIVRRAPGIVSAKNMEGRTIDYPLAVTGRESVISGLRDPQKFPELSQLREELLSWRFYHHFRTDMESPLRMPQIGVMTPVMSHDGFDLAAALATIKAMGEHNELQNALGDAFPGASLNVDAEDGLFSISLHTQGINRPFDGQELSDGTLQYLCLLAALLTPRPPVLMILNEPECSIHPDLFKPLAKLIQRAANKCQMVVTTHSRDLANFLKREGNANLIEFEKNECETHIRGSKLSRDDD